MISLVGSYFNPDHTVYFRNFEINLEQGSFTFKGIDKVNNKNLYQEGQLKESDLMKKYNNQKIDDNICGQTQSKLKQDHLQDSRGILYTKKSGLVKNLFFGHGDQKNFEKKEYATTYL